MIHLQESSSKWSLLAAATPPDRRMVTAGASRQIQTGQALAEYAVILALVVLVAAAGFSTFGIAIVDYMTNTVNAIITFF